GTSPGRATTISKRADRWIPAAATTCGSPCPAPSPRAAGSRTARTTKASGSDAPFHDRGIPDYLPKTPPTRKRVLYSFLTQSKQGGPMATVTLKGNPIHSAGELPSVGSKAPDFKLTKGDLSDVSLKDFAGKKIILNIFPSIDT